MTGYGIQANDGPLGSLSDFLVDQKKWRIRQFTVKTGHWFSGSEILITPTNIERTSDGVSKVFVKITKGSLQRTAEQHFVTAFVLLFGIQYWLMDRWPRQKLSFGIDL